jgi:hypothetical protein
MVPENPKAEEGGMSNEPNETIVELAARADAAFAGRDFDGLSKSDKSRFLDRAHFVQSMIVLGRIIGMERLKTELADRADKSRRGTI